MRVSLARSLPPYRLRGIIAFMDGGKTLFIEKAIRNSSLAVFEALSGREPLVEAGFESLDFDDGTIGVRVEVIGVLTGWLLLVADDATARRVVSQQTDNTEYSVARAHDTLGELANQILGNVAGHLGGDAPWEMTPPIAVSGPFAIGEGDHSLSFDTIWGQVFLGVRLELGDVPEAAAGQVGDLDIDPELRILELETELAGMASALDHAQRMFDSRHAVLQKEVAELRKATDEKNRALERLQQAQVHLIRNEKLVAMGELVAGVSHELNNSLSPIMGYAEILADKEQEPVKKHQLEVILESALSAQKVVGSLLLFSRRKSGAKKPCDLNEVIKRSVEMAAFRLKKTGAGIELRLEEGIPPTDTEPVQLTEIIMNLIHNSHDSLPSGEGTIIVSTGVGDKGVEIAVSDNGSGIAEEDQKKIFDPFFTTKEVGKGTGLGLSIVYGVVQEHGGEIVVESAPGEGTTFRIFLPPSEGELPKSARREDMDSDTLSRILSGKRVLFVDDNLDLSNVFRSMFLDCELVSAGDGQAGLRFLEEEDFDLVMLDMLLPGIDGDEVYSRLEESGNAHAEKVVFMTGAAADKHVEEYLAGCGRPYVGKPFNAVEIAAAVATIISKQEAKNGEHPEVSGS